MNLTVVGILVGTILAFAALIFHFWGFLLVALFMTIGAFVGRVADGKLDLRSVRDALAGRRSSS
ncbi:hypothetical protein ASH00_05860 [Arthrobacter sp. Soil782]|uniref:DUF2273 domain-containing protein n=1 Tax=Arthrobacter sp. Soil782 TaxID=1736410 RepID=UPI0006FD6A15|nr:DUF2273 domain-containing protein [Arthrobacter sp. Soil782]KRF09166.1 hypothetical protein ASH00_05860 [Arthrobacter sp. Soil782]